MFGHLESFFTYSSLQLPLLMASLIRTSSNQSKRAYTLSTVSFILYSVPEMKHISKELKDLIFRILQPEKTRVTIE